MAKVGRVLHNPAGFCYLPLLIKGKDLWQRGKFPAFYLDKTWLCAYHT